MRFLPPILFLILSALPPLHAQQSDRTRVFTLEEFFNWIALNHPIARQAALLDDGSRANLRMAHGYFDPKLYSDWEQKSFGGEQYYTFGENGLKVPTWYGLELKAAFNTASGIRVDPEHKLPSAGQAVLGIKASLGQGLIIDQRRAALQQARIFTQSNEAERRIMLNNLFLEAAQAYWTWTAAYNQRNAIAQAFDLAQVRQQGIVESYRQGDKPAIDTLEAFLQVQIRQIELNDAELNRLNTSLMLSNFLWLEDNTPLELTPLVRPPQLDTMYVAAPLPPLESFLELAQTSHPEILYYQLKISNLDVDRRLAAEQLKPRLDLEYNFLGNGTNLLYSPNGADNPFTDLIFQNYKWGLHFSFPLFLRKERGKLELARLKIQDAGFELQQKRLETENKVRWYYNELQNTQRQLSLFTEMVSNNRRMLDAEFTRFQLGDSSIFLINAREQKLVEAQLKLIKLWADYNKLRLSLEWAAGQLD